MYLPQTEPGRIDALAGSLDLMPTILELAGLEIPEAVQAPSLIPLIQGERDQLHNYIITSWPLYNPGQPIRVVDDFERRVIEPLPSTITDGEWTLLYATEGEAVELYHMPSDPKQDQNIFEDNQGVARDLHAHFVEFLESVGTDETLVAPRRWPLRGNE